MNKILFLIVVSLPSLSYASKDVCEYIVDEIAKEKPYGDIVEAISSRHDMELGGATELNLLVTAAGLGGGLNGNNKEAGLKSCSQEIARQQVASIQGTIKRRSGTTVNSVPAGGTSGGTSGGDMGSEVGHVIHTVELQDESRGLRNQGVAFGAMGGNFIGGSSGGLVHQSDALTKCELLSDTETCSIQPNGDISDLAKSSIQLLPNDIQQCMCLSDKASKQIPNDQERKKAIAAEQVKLKKIVINNLGKKFINQYASHLEDVRYFTVTSKQTFGSDPVTQAAEAEKVRCSKQSDFKNAIIAKCGNSISAAEMNSKLDNIFSLLGQKANGLDYLDILGEKVMVNSGPNGKKFQRDDFDIIRDGLVRSDKTVQFADNLVSAILKDNDAVSTITAGGSMPYEGFVVYISTQLRTNKSRFIKRFFSEDILGKDKFREVVKSFDNVQVAMTSIGQSLDYAMEVHPGFDNLMRKNDLFKETSEKIKRGSKSAINTIETTYNLMKKRFAAGCEDLKQQLAQVVCTKDEDLLRSIGKNELRHVVKGSDLKDNLLLTDVAICENGGQFDGVGAFKELAIEATDRQSDILERLTEKDVTKHKNLFSKIMLKNGNKDDVTTTFIARAAEEGYRNRRGVEGDSFGKQFGVSSDEKVSFISPETMNAIENKSINSYKEESKTVINNSLQPSNEVSPQLAPTYANNYSAALKDYQDTVASKPATQEKFDPRSELREFLSNKENKESVDRFMKETDDSRLADLARLREESEKNREQLLRLSTDNEKLKLQQMQEQLADLEQKRSKAVSANVVADEEEDADPRSSGRGSRDIASVSSGDSSGVSSGSFSGGKAGGSAGGSGSERTAITNARNELSNGLSTNSESAASEPVVISAATARSGSLEIKSTELSKEILNFLETEPDVQTLINMRKSGMIYKYKVMENGKEVTKEITIDYKALTEDVKKLIEQKIADSGKAGSEAKRLSAEIKDLRRAYSYNALKIILGEQMKVRR